MVTSSRPLALVTGASVGIGAAIAEELARRGHDLVLVARNREQLEANAESLSRRHSIAVEVLPADLTLSSDVGEVAARLTGDGDSGGRPVDVLVNNAGRGSHGDFAGMDLGDQLGMIDLNVRSVVHLTHAALAAMLPRGSGRILNVASTAAFQPTPKESVYAASKAFVLSFSEGIHEELRGTGVTVTVVCPGFTRSEFQERAGVDASKLPNAVWQEAEEVATAALDSLQAGRAVCVPGAVNKLLGGVTKLTPRGVVRRSSGAVMRRFG